MLNGLVRRMDGSVAADAATVAESRTTTGCHLRVSLGLAPPPASSFLYYDVGRRHTPGHPDHGPGFGLNFFYFAVVSTFGLGSIAEEGL